MNLWIFFWFFSASLTLSQALCCVLRRFMCQEHKVLKVSRHFPSVRRHRKHNITSVWGKGRCDLNLVKSESWGLLWGRALGGSFKQGSGRNLGKGGCVYEMTYKAARILDSNIPASHFLTLSWDPEAHDLTLPTTEGSLLLSRRSLRFSNFIFLKVPSVLNCSQW